MDKVTIPPETLKAMRTAAEKVYGTQFFNEEIEAAARAMLAAWPEAWIAPSLDNGRDCLALPIPPQETSHE
jgi:hypothetical protein